MSGLWSKLDANLVDKYPTDEGIFTPSPYRYFSRHNPEKTVSAFYSDKFPSAVGREWMPSMLQAFRADPSNKHGTKTGLESRPTPLDMKEMEQYLQAYRVARHRHPDIVPKLSPQQFVNMALNEGRGDFGYNSGPPTEQNKQSMKVFNDLSSRGYGWEAPGFVSALIEKYQKAKELRKPFDEVWNGTGRSDVTGRSGKQNAQRMKQGSYAADHELNKPFLDFVRYNLDPGETMSEYNARYDAREKEHQKVEDAAPFLSKAQHVAHQFINAVPDPSEYVLPPIAPRAVNPLQQDIEQWQREQSQRQANATPLPDDYRVGGRVRMI